MFRRSVIVVIINIVIFVSTYDLKLEDNGPIVIGGTIWFRVSVYDDDRLTTDNLKFKWNDNAIPQHRRETDEVERPTDVWNVTYTAGIYPAGAYIAQVIVYTCTIFYYCYPDGSARIEFDITENLNGKMVLIQQNRTLGQYISTKEPVLHSVQVKQTDMDYIKTAPTLRTYWFVDCTYYGITSDLEFSFTYKEAYQTHTVEALVVADFTPLPTTTVPSTTTTTRITTTTHNPNITTTSTTPATTTTSATKKPGVDKTVSKSNIKKRHVSDLLKEHKFSNIKIWSNGSLVPYNVSFPYVCNSSYISTDSTKTYGYFYQKFEAKDPLSKINVTGNNWLQPGDMLSLQVQCNGSKNFDYCIEYKKGEYNVTGNETCQSYQPINECAFTVRRFLTSPKSTVVIIIKNDINKEVMPVTVNIYKVKKQNQLSVIVVPVAFSLVAVVMIVFGVAYYFQNRSRFIIEVADFNFGQQYSDMEYKTFRERLKDSIANAFTRTPTPSSSEVPVWPPGRKYGSMT